MSLKDEVIRVSARTFVDKIIEYGSQFFPHTDLEVLRACIQCGNCVGSCPSGRRTAWKSRVIFRKAMLGLENEIFHDENLWDCTTCYTCYERCPRSIKTTDIIRIIRNIAVKRGFMLDPHLKVCEIFYNYGHAVPINEEAKASRRRLKLMEMPPTVHLYPKALSEVQKIIEITGFSKIIEVGRKHV